MSAASAQTLTVQGWWDALPEGRLLLLHCQSCAGAWLPWTPFCPDCGRGPGSTVIEASGSGTLQSWVEIHYSLSFPDDVPFIVGAVRLDEGPILYGRLESDAAASVTADMVVKARFVKRGGRFVAEFGPVAPSE